ncbi:MAG: hypothetical protein K9L75_03040 [Spirochaetia bacterium]|nr:hypothetical protein [Spirochaetia bacterium]
MMKKLSGKMLESMGYSVVEAANGEEVLQLCEELKDKASKNSGTKISSADNAVSENVDRRDSDADDKELFTAAFFDLTIPGGMGGKETLSAIRKICKKMPIFASSGYSEDPIISSPQHYGFTDSIAKPFKIEELAALLEKHLKKS